MKRILTIVLSVLVILAGFVACVGGNDDPGSNGGDAGQNAPQDATQTVYEKLNELSSRPYDQILLTVTTTTGGTVLKADYNMTADRVVYAVEQLNELQIDGQFEDTPPPYKRTVNGTAVVKNGEIVKVNEDAVNLPAYREMKGAFHFAAGYLDDLTAESGRMTAGISDVSSFLGTDKTMDHASITVIYNDAAFEEITIHYEVGTTEVVAVYRFENHSS